MRAGAVRTTGGRWAPLALLFTLGMSSSPMLPIWLAGAAKRFQFTTSQSGMAASLELACLAFASISWAALSRKRRSTIWLVAALGLSAAGNLASFLAANAPALIAARAVTGLCLGLILSEITGRAARTPDPHRVFALQQLALVAFVATFFSTVPVAIAKCGPFAPFLYAAGLSVLGLASTLWLPAVDTEADPQAVRAPSAGTLDAAALVGVGMTLTALALTYMAQAAIWTYITEAARGAGVSLQVLGRILAIGAVANLLAPLGAERLGLRWGRLAPLLIGYAGLASAILLLAFGQGLGAFAAGAVGLNLFLLFLTPFLLGALAAWDASGRSAAAGPAFFTGGGAIGPALAGLVIGKAGLALTGALFAGVAVAALALAALAAVRITPATAVRRPAQGSEPQSAC